MKALYSKIQQNKRNIKEDCLFYCVLALAVGLVYHTFISGESYFLTKLTAMDQFEQVYPSFISLARHIKEYGMLVQMDYSEALGTIMSPLPILVTNLPAYFGEDNIPYLMGVFQILKVFLSGVFFYGFLKIRGTKPIVSGIGALAYAFCGHMMLRQWWHFYSTEALLFAIWLWSFEKAYSQHKVWYLPFASVLFFLHCYIYYCVLYTGIFCLYCIFRMLCDESFLQRRKLLMFVCMTALISSFIGAGLTGYMTQLGSAVEKTTSYDRGGTAKDTGAGGYGAYENEELFTSTDTLTQVFLKTMGITKGGGDKSFTRSRLPEGTFYCLLLMISTLPLYMFYSNKRKKIMYSIGIMAALVYIFILPIRILANAFSSTNFKNSSFWIIVLLIFIATEGLDSFIALPKRKSALSVCIWSLVLCLSLIVIYELNIKSIDRIQTGIAMLLLLFYGTLFCCIAYFPGFSPLLYTMPYVFLFAASIEASLFGWNVTSEGDYQTPLELSRNGYKDSTMDALDYIESIEDVKDYRVDKQFFTFRLTDSLAQNYYGTYFYNGSSAISDDTRDFYDLMNLPSTYDNSNFLYKYAFGTSYQTGVNEILGVKYILTRSNSIINYGYEYLTNVNGINIYKNPYSVPMACSFDAYMLRSEFENLSLAGREKALLECIIVEDDNEGSVEKAIKHVDMNRFNGQAEVAIDNQYEIDGTMSSDYIYHIPNSSLGNTIVIKAHFELDAPECNARLWYHRSDGGTNWYFVRVDSGSHDYTYEINADTIDAVWITTQSSIMLPWECTKAYSVPRDEYHKEYVKDCVKLHESGIDVKEFTSRKLSGNVSMEKAGILQLAVPYGNWSVYVDGQKKEPIVSDITFIGCMIEKGSHDVEFIFNKGFPLTTDAWIKVIVLVITLLIVPLGKLVDRRKMNVGHLSSNSCVQ